MFCGQCGTKNEKGAAFCENCGAKLKEVSKEESKEKESTVKKVEKKKKDLTKKQKILIAVIAIVLVVSFGYYKSLEKKASPETVVKNYLNAINNQDYETIYNMLDVSSSSEFVSKKAYKEALAKMIQSKGELGIINVGTVSYEDGGLKAVVPFTSSKYKSNSILTSDNSLKINLTKTLNKKYIFFNDWKIDDSTLITLDTVKNYYIKAPKDTKVTFGGVVVNDKYIDSSKNGSKEKSVVYYKLPEVLKAETSVFAKLKDGTEVTGKVTPSSYNTMYTVSVTKSNLSNTVQSKLLEAAKTDFNTVVKGLLDEKSFSNIKENFSSKESLDNLESNYNYGLRNRKNSNYAISNYQLTDAEISSVSIGTNCLYEVKVSIDYKYDSKYKNDEEASTNNQDRSAYFTFYYSYEDNYKLVNMSSMPSFY